MHGNFRHSQVAVGTYSGKSTFVFCLRKLEWYFPFFSVVHGDIYRLAYPVGFSAMFVA